MIAQVAPSHKDLVCDDGNSVIQHCLSVCTQAYLLKQVRLVVMEFLGASISLLEKFRAVPGSLLEGQHGGFTLVNAGFEVRLAEP